MDRSASLPAEELAGFVAYVDGLAAADAFSGAILVAVNGLPVLERAWGPASRAYGVPNRVDTRFNLGSMNFSIHTIGRRYRPEDYRFEWEQRYVEESKRRIFPNTFGDMETFAATMREHGTRPEFEAYDVGHLYNLRYLVRAGFAEAPHWIQFVLGVLGGLGNSPEDLMAMKATADRLFGPDGYRWSVIGVGYPAEINLAAMAMIMGGHVRVGLEDNLFKRRGDLATNAELVEKAVRLATELDREVAMPDEARALLGLKGKDAIIVE